MEALASDRAGDDFHSDGSAIEWRCAVRAPISVPRTPHPPFRTAALARQGPRGGRASEVAAPARGNQRPQEPRVPSPR
eukprot:2254146-Prymnesium_polylepis.1